MFPESTSQYDSRGSPGSTSTAPALAVTRSTWSTPKSSSTGVSANSCAACKSAATSLSETDSTFTAGSAVFPASVSGVISHPCRPSMLHYIETANFHLLKSICRWRSTTHPVPYGQLPGPRPCEETSQSSEPRQILVHKLHRNRTLAHCRRHPLHRSVPHIAGHEHPRHARLQQVRLAILLPLRRQLAIHAKIWSRQQKTFLVP